MKYKENELFVDNSLGGVTLSDIDNLTEFIFYVDENGKNAELLRISSEGFFYRGEKVDDAHNVYERFNEWLKQAYK